MIYGEIFRQRLTLGNEHIVADTIDYLEIKFLFKTDDWDGLEKWAHFTKDGTVYDIPLTADCIRREDHLNLSAGVWTVYLHGNEFADGKVIGRITTNTAIFEVIPTGTLDGEPFPEIPASGTERIHARLARLEAGGGAADSVSWSEIVGRPEASADIEEDKADFTKYTTPSAVHTYVGTKMASLEKPYDLPEWITQKTYRKGEEVWEEREIAFRNANAMLADFGGGFKVNAGLEYDVYWNGERYPCEGRMYDGEPYIGNGSLVFVGVENTGEPFCLYGNFFDPDAIGYVKKDTQAAETIRVEVTLRGSVTYDKMPEEYLPDGVVKSVNGVKPDAGGNVTVPAGGGASIDVTAEVGQTIVVREVDADGKPTKWEAAEYQPKTHWKAVEDVDLIPETVFTSAFNDGFGVPMYQFPAETNLEVGKEYRVYFDGVEYIRTAKVGAVNSLTAMYIGNDIMTNGNNTGEPFIFVSIPAFGSSSVVCFDESEHTMRVVSEEEVVHQIPDEYVSGNDVVIKVVDTADGGHLAYMPWEDIVAAYNAGKNLYVEETRSYSNGNETRRYPFCSFYQYGTDSSEGMFTFCTFLLENSAGEDVTMRYVTITRLDNVDRVEIYEAVCGTSTEG